ncbi:MAG: hypothetical protein U0946_06615 [Patescibacteria group bacterium]|nr:hypothetical protein [Patescibacteria group bacterium]
MNEFNKARLILFGWYVIVNLILLSTFSLVAIRAERQSFAQIENLLSDKIQRPVLSQVLEG